MATSGSADGASALRRSQELASFEAKKEKVEALKQLPDLNISPAHVEDMAAGGVTAFCQRKETDLKKKMKAVKELIDDPFFGKTLGEIEDETKPAEGWCAKGRKILWENKAEIAGTGLAVGIPVVGGVMSHCSHAANAAAASKAMDAASTADALRANILTQLNSGAEFSDAMKRELFDKGNCTQEWLDTASKADVQEYFSGKGKSSATLQDIASEKTQSRDAATTAADQNAAIAAFVQMAIALVMLRYTVKQANEVFGWWKKDGGKMKDWRERLDLLIAEEVYLQNQLKRFFPEFEALLCDGDLYEGLGHGIGERKDGGDDGNQLVWSHLGDLLRQVTQLHKKFTDLQSEVAADKTWAAQLQSMTFSAGASGSVTTIQNCVAVGSRGGFTGAGVALGAATAFITIGTVAAWIGFGISTNVRNTLQAFEDEIAKHIKDVTKLVDSYTTLNQVAGAHWKHYKECKKGVVSVWERRAKEAEEAEARAKEADASAQRARMEAEARVKEADARAKEAEARMDVLLMLEKKGFTPEMLARLAASDVQPASSEKAATGGA